MSRRDTKPANVIGLAERRTRRESALVSTLTALVGDHAERVRALITAAVEACPGRWPERTIDAAIEAPEIFRTLDVEGVIEVLDDNARHVRALEAPAAIVNIRDKQRVPASSLPDALALAKTHAALDALIRREAK